MELTYMVEHNLIEPLLRAFNWPTLDVCHDLNLPQQLIQLITHPNSVPDENAAPQGDARDIIIRDLQAMVQQLQQATRTTITTKSRVDATKADERDMDGKENKITFNTYLERRRCTVLESQLLHRVRRLNHSNG
jgi:hypothetical protein